jgi:hypothetical protein
MASEPTRGPNPPPASVATITLGTHETGMRGRSAPQVPHRRKAVACQHRVMPRGVRLPLWLLLAYLASPVDVIPDFVPVAGYADDAIVVALALR